jgi:cardiolipin-specific phospholipase
MMLSFWSSATDPLKNLRTAEAKLVEYAKKFGDRDPDTVEIKVTDTPIPSEALPLKHSKKNSNTDLYIHSIRVKSEDYLMTTNTRKKTTPLVLVHGYMNGAMYFYRNLVGLSNFFETVYSLDTLGCGLSSRCPNLLKSDALDTSLETTESLFVESLEAWRKANKIPKMILAGHSMGGYISVAYCEKYPQHVEQLVLISPAGVTQADPEQTRDFSDGKSWGRRISISGARWLFDYGVTPAGFLRTLPTSRGRSMIEGYIQNRLPSIKDPNEQQILTDYLYSNTIVPGSGEDMLSRFLTSSAYGRVPTVDRIPNLLVAKVSFVYGDHDWMDINGGLQVWKKATMAQGPSVDVYKVQNAGHLLMLDNWRGFHAGLITVCGGSSMLNPRFPTPLRIHPIS